MGLLARHGVRTYVEQLWYGALDCGLHIASISIVRNDGYDPILSRVHRNRMAIDDWDQSMAIQKRGFAQMDVGTPHWMVYLLGISSPASPIFPTTSPSYYDTVHPYGGEMEA